MQGAESFSITTIIKVKSNFLSSCIFFSLTSNSKAPWKFFLFFCCVCVCVFFFSRRNYRHAFRMKLNGAGSLCVMLFSFHKRLLLLFTSFIWWRILCWTWTDVYDSNQSDDHFSSFIRSFICSFDRTFILMCLDFVAGYRPNMSQSRKGAHTNTNALN